VPPDSGARGDPWRKAPVGELQEQLLPRWFVLLAVASVPVAIVVFVVAFFAGGTQEVPAAERRPPPTERLTHDVGEIALGEAPPDAWQAQCPALEGIRVAGLASDLEALDAGLRAVCEADLDGPDEAAVAALAGRGAVVRFAAFELTGVDSTVERSTEPPIVLLNGRFTATDPTWIAPLIVHDAVLLAGDPAAAETALAAREAEHRVCQRLFADERPSRGCDDAAAVVALPDPLGALRDAGYR
jgi:hypothetical protein